MAGAGPEPGSRLTRVRYERKLVAVAAAWGDPDTERRMRVGILVVALAMTSCAPRMPGGVGADSRWVEVLVAADSSSYDVDHLSIAKLTYQDTVVHSAWVRQRLAKPQNMGSSRNVGAILYLQYFDCEAHTTAVLKQRYYQAGTEKFLVERDFTVLPPQLMRITPGSINEELLRYVCSQKS
jgi:hypothetical protein